MQKFLKTFENSIARKQVILVVYQLVGTPHHFLLSVFLRNNNCSNGFQFSADELQATGIWIRFGFRFSRDRLHVDLVLWFYGFSRNQGLRG